LAERSEEKARKFKFLTQIFTSRSLASLRSAIFSQIKVDNKLVIFPARVNQFLKKNNKLVTFLSTDSPKQIIFLLRASWACCLFGFINLCQINKQKSEV